VSDRTDDRYPGGGNRARQPFIVECGEILDRPAATGQQQQIAVRALQRNLERLQQFFCRAFALNLCRKDGYREVWRAASQHLDDITDGGTRGGGDDAQPSRERGKGLFALVVEQTLRLQTFFQCLEFTLGRACSGRFQVFDDQLKITAWFVEADPRTRQHLRAVGGFEAQQLSFGPKQGAAHLGMGIFQTEVQMAGAGAGQVGDLSLDPDQREAALQNRAHLRVQAADAEDVALIGGGSCHIRGVGIHRVPRNHS